MLKNSLLHNTEYCFKNGHGNVTLTTCSIVRHTRGSSFKTQHPHKYIKTVYNFIKFMARETELNPHGNTIEL